METFNNSGYSLPAMPSRGQQIRIAREARGWSQADLARKVGISQPAIKKIEADETKRSRYLADIERILELPADAVAEPMSGRIHSPVTLPVESASTLGILPVYAAAEGGSGALILSTDPIDYMPRPDPLAHAKGGYGILVIGDSMVPAFEPGDTLLVNPALPPMRDTDVVLYYQGGGEVKVTIKRLLRFTDTHWWLRQWNPPKKGAEEFKDRKSVV